MVHSTRRRRITHDMRGDTPAAGVGAVAAGISAAWAAASSICDMIFPFCRYFLPGPSSFMALRTSRSEEHTSELQSLMRISYAVFCLKKKTQQIYSLYTT